MISGPGLYRTTQGFQVRIIGRDIVRGKTTTTISWRGDAGEGREFDYRGDGVCITPMILMYCSPGYWDIVEPEMTEQCERGPGSRLSDEGYGRTVRQAAEDLVAAVNSARVVGLTVTINHQDDEGGFLHLLAEISRIIRL